MAQNRAQLRLPSRSVTQRLLQHWLLEVHAAVSGRPQQPSWQISLLQALAVVHAPPTPTEPAATQKPKLHALLAQMAFDAQAVPLGQRPQSLVHCSPRFVFPQASRPSQ
jgi:hypothetical protein